MVPRSTMRRTFRTARSARTGIRRRNSVRRLTVYTPPGYDRDQQTRYPVVYLFHGANADENAWYRLGRVNLILDNLLAAGKINPFLVVMPFGYGVEKDLVPDVIPYIQSQYRTAADRDHRAIVGLSMGGGQALSIGLNHLELRNVGLCVLGGLCVRSSWRSSCFW